MKLPRVTGLLAGCFALFIPALAAPVGQFAESADIGAPAQHQFAWNKLKGDFIVRARIEFVGMGVDPHRKAGWIARSSLDAGSPYADACVHGDGLTSLQYRRTGGAVTEQLVLPLTGGDVVQLERRGNTYIFSSARYGETFVSQTLTDLDLGEELFVGLFACSHDAKVKEEIIFKDVRIIQPPKAGYQPYRDYIGAHLEILNVHTGQLETVYSSP